MEEIKKFYSELIKDDKFKTKLYDFIQKNGNCSEKIIEELILPQSQNMGYNFTKDQLISYEKNNKTESLSNEDLINIAGGFGLSPIFASITLGSLVALSSAFTTGSGYFNFSNSTKNAPAETTSYSRLVSKEGQENYDTSQNLDNYSSKIKTQQKNNFNSWHKTPTSQKLKSRIENDFNNQNKFSPIEQKDSGFIKKINTGKRFRASVILKRSRSFYEVDHGKHHRKDRREKPASPAHHGPEKDALRHRHGGDTGAQKQAAGRAGGSDSL